MTTSTPPHQSLLRTARTLFVHRWHAAQTIGEWLGNESVGERFEHINHVRSLAQYVWRYGAFREDDDGTGRIPLMQPGTTPAPLSLSAIVKPVAARGREHFEQAVRYAARFGDADPLVQIDDTGPGSLAGADPQLADLLGYAARNPDIPTFAKQLARLHRAMIPYYAQMRALAPSEADAFRRGHVPILTSLRGGSRHPAEQTAGPLYTGPLPGDLSAALLGTFASSLHHALACRARSELFETLARHPRRGLRIATEAGGRVPGRSVTTSVLVQGRRRRFVVHDRALASMLQSLDEGPMPRLVQWLSAFKTAVSAMITAMPVFIVKNFFRDTLAGFVAGRHPQLPFLGTLAGGVHAFRDLVTGRSEAMHGYLLQGGFYSGLVESETHLADLRDERGRVRKGLAARRAWSRLVYLLTRPAWLSEAGTRVNQFQRARRVGATNYAAARAARMVSSDFANIGSSRGWRMYVHTVPFLNAAIQGLDQLYQICRRRWRPDSGAPKRSPEQRAHVRKMLWSGACLGAMSCAAWGFNASAPARRAAYQGETDYEKASWVTLYDVAGETDVRVPVPFQIGATFIKLPEVALDLITGRETLAGPKFVWSLVHGNLAVGWIPVVLQPIVEIRTNRNFFGDEIIPGYMANWQPERQFFDRSTPLPYRSVGTALNVSPLHVQTVVRGWSGHLGNLVVTALDEVMWDEAANGPKPFPRTARLLTGVYSLQPTRPRTYSRYGNEFYDLSDWAEGRARSLPCSGEPLVPAVCLLRTLSARTAREASELRRQGDEIRTDAAKGRQQKERELEAVYAQIDGLFREALPVMQELRGLGVAMVDSDLGSSQFVGRAGRTPQAPTERPSRPEQVGPTASGGANGCVNVNSASEAELDRLPGIGPVLAGRIVAEREAGGPFSGYQDLQRVRGIGPKTVERMREMVCGGG